MVSLTCILCIVGRRKTVCICKTSGNEKWPSNFVKSLKGNCFKGINVAKPLIQAFGKPQMSSN